MTLTKLTKLTSLDGVAGFRAHTRSLGITIGIDEELAPSSQSPLHQPIAWNGRTIGNRIAIQPMEGWDGTTAGGVTPPMLRRWERFGESGAKLIWGGEAMAVRPDGRANPNQLILSEENAGGISALRERLIQSHQAHYGRTDDLIIGFQLTHSGRFCRPNDKKRWEPRVAYRHPLLDPKFNVTSDEMVWTDEQLGELIGNYADAARLAKQAGADFVDIKSCHGYLLHEFLGARSRPGPFGGDYEGRTRLLFSIVRAVQAAAPELGIGVRLSAYDTVPFQPNPKTAEPGKQGQGMPMPHEHLLPYTFGFGLNPDRPLEMDLTETHRLLGDLQELGVSMINLSAGSPYYTPHLLRPAAYPPSDGYQPHEDPLISVAKHLQAAAQLKKAHPKLLVVGSGYSYLQEFLPNVAQHQVAHGNVDFVGMGRMVLSYPKQMVDAVERGTSERKLVCRTFSDCTTAPRNGLPSGCYPLDDYYKKSEDAKRLKEIKANL
ncbi:NADPH dehydrogenase [Pirellula sp. SH-Sr6A]|uniref:oxidoreductase n=1 Tax=Pirellula sp. SH-Sr6A TaxID=1632865 RepID=UPI00078EA12D|nr:NADH:flavin oxidoreductase [Pirellula sp. SH-Sr6A]AMV34764.1 NADPH dehydrogenase [Pirellula sp. SH-Sr6A]